MTRERTPELASLNLGVTLRGSREESGRFRGGNSPSVTLTDPGDARALPAQQVAPERRPSQRTRIPVASRTGWPSTQANRSAFGAAGVGAGTVPADGEASTTVRGVRTYGVERVDQFSHGRGPSRARG